MKIYLVEQHEADELFQVAAIFAHEEDAKLFARMLEDKEDVESVEVVERTLFYSQPSHRGFNL